MVRPERASSTAVASLPSLGLLKSVVNPGFPEIASDVQAWTSSSISAALIRLSCSEQKHGGEPFGTILNAAATGGV